VSEQEKRWYTVDEARKYLHITELVLMRKINFWNIEIRRLPGSNKEYIATRDVLLIERSMKEPGFMA
jgi:hypothetical protein